MRLRKYVYFLYQHPQGTLQQHLKHAVPVVVLNSNDKSDSFWAQHFTLLVVMISTIITLLGIFFYNFCKTQRLAEIAEFSNKIQQSFRFKNGEKQ